MIKQECSTCKFSTKEHGETLCTNEDRLWSKSPEPVASYQMCRLWEQEDTQ